MEEFAYQFLINFIALFTIWSIWFGIAAKLHNKNQMIYSTELTVHLFIVKMFGLLGGGIAFIIYYIIKKAVSKKRCEPKRETYNEYIEQLEKEKAVELKPEAVKAVTVKPEVIHTPPAPVEKKTVNEITTDIGALYDIASNIEVYEKVRKARFSAEERDCLQKYLKIYEQHLDICRQIVYLEGKLPPDPQVNEITVAYIDLKKSEKLLNEEIQYLAQTTTLQNVFNHRLIPPKKVNSNKPLIIVTYIFLIAVIIALSVFCVLSVKDIKVKENTISQLEIDKTVLQHKMKNTEAELKYTEAKLKNANTSLANTESKLNHTRSELTKALSDATYWKNKYMATDSSNVTYSYDFSSVNALLSAIKNNPTAYNNKQVKVFGMIFAYEHATFNRKEIALIDYKGEELSYGSGVQTRFFKNQKTEAKEAIEVTLSSDLQYTVSETGDYVNLYGTVRITNGEIYLDKCQYN